ncbi:MAG: PAS domain-containing protein [Chromatiaceae bacterium]|nr:PAS domain-containing protein [Gammaproteobacteria bacterium]MCB1862961.1 PAS domain-containing protein [Gammaproteobacteria bacterium]MCB1881690.1 PAS domain-containing protein [Gammaproteobacteria bacterium]MCP5445785.1 PAS domain-containing protein [Chromatiaceae bacterium]
MKYTIQPLDRERQLPDDSYIVSKTDLKGRITYANRIFMDVARYIEPELLGVQHNLIRHPDMPRGAFKLVWDKIEQGQEVFAYVKNLAKDGQYYWVFANITPDKDAQGNITGYLSVRRKPRRDAVAIVEPIYRQMLSIEKQHPAKNQMDHSIGFLVDALDSKGVSYEEFILAI